MGQLATQANMGDGERMYGSMPYWEERYKTNAETFEWYQSYEPALKEHIRAAFPNTAGKCIDLGCGTSNLAKDMKKDGYEGLCVDFSDACVNNQKALGFNAQVEDVTDMKGCNTAEFDYAIDKGTLDSILCGANSTQNAYKYLKEVARILKPGGVFMVVSYGNAKKRGDHFARISDFGGPVVKNIDKPKAVGVSPGPGMEAIHHIYTLQRN